MTSQSVTDFRVGAWVACESSMRSFSRTRVFAALLLSAPLPVLAAEMVKPAPADPTPFVLEGATDEQSQMRGALLDASWDLPEEVMLRIQGVASSDKEAISENLSALIDPQTTAVHLPFVDLALGATGPDAIVERRYSSRSTVASDFGPGWAWSFGAKITKTGSDLVLQDGFGGEIAFSPIGEKTWAATMLGQQIELKSTGYLRTATGEGSAERYDRNGFLVDRLDASGRKVTVQRNDKGFALAIVASNGRKLTIKSDASGKIVSMADPAGRTAVYSYQDGRLAKTSIAGLETAYAYDAEGLLTMVTFPDASKLALRYNQGGAIEEIRLGDKVVKAAFTGDPATPAVHGASIRTGTDTTRFSFDEAQGRAEILHPDGAKETLAADLKLGSLATSSFGTQKSLYEHDALGRVTKVDGIDGTLSLTYGVRTVKQLQLALDGGAPIIVQFDDSGNAVRMQQDKQTVEVLWVNGQAVETKVNGRVARRSEYDANGDLTAVHDENGRTLRIRYDAAGMVTSLERPSHTLVEIAPQDGAFLPKIRLTRTLAKGTMRQVLDAPEMAFLYGDFASLRASKRAGLDLVGGEKFAGLGVVPVLGGVPILADCFGDLFLCQVGYSFKCLGIKLLADISPIGSPLDFDPKTGEVVVDPAGYIWEQYKDILKDASADLGKAILKDVSVNGGGIWKKAATKARQTLAISKGILRALKPLIKKLALPVKLLMAVKTAYECSTSVSDNSMTLCNPDRLCPDVTLNPNVPKTQSGKWFKP